MTDVVRLAEEHLHWEFCCDLVFGVYTESCRSNLILVHIGTMNSLLYNPKQVQRSGNWCMMKQLDLDLNKIYNFHLSQFVI
jgi:hypothetical protein